MTAITLAWAIERLGDGKKVGIASVISTSGSVPGKEGARLALCDSDSHGTIGGAGLELSVSKRLRELVDSAVKPCGEVLTFGLNKGAKGYEVTPLDSLCGGRVTVALEVLIPMPHILLMGGGHCAIRLLKLASHWVGHTQYKIQEQNFLLLMVQKRHIIPAQVTS